MNEKKNFSDLEVTYMTQHLQNVVSVQKGLLSHNFWKILVSVIIFLLNF